MTLPAAFLATPIAHRGYHDRAAGRIENSRAAVTAAVAAGYGIEIDLQLSADGRAMVFHDDTLDRLTAERGPVAARTAEALGAIALTGGGEAIPSFAEILALVAGRVPLLVEIKDQDGAMGASVGALEAAAAGDLAGYAGPVAVMSFNPHSMMAMARLAPDVPRGLVTSAYDPAVWAPLPATICDRLRGIPDYDACGATFISHEWRDLARPRVAELAAQGA
ncbi:MAG: glycerophosphodiester phosphodiesterase family protein, partial [Gemmobacter sp.]